jgi:drug/metabolite transporter (DMT)-like permease
MIYLLFCILTNVGIFVCFRMFKASGLNTFQAIVFNYITCVVTGLIFLNDSAVWQSISFSSTWVQIGILLGGVFVASFYLIAITTQKFSMTVSSIAAKMSLIIPALISLFVLNIESKEYSILNYLGMVLALAAIVLSSYKKKNINNPNFDILLLLPLFVFILGGLIDSTINYTNYKYLTAEFEPIFPIVLFLSAAIIGSIILLVQRARLNLKSILGGMILGVINYFSIYFMLKSLTSFNNDGALVYPILNVGIILITVLVSVLFFREKLSRLNIAGLVFAVVSILLISYQELQIILRW